ncbi:MAG: hypothetical protein HY268_24050 [Deltaproteobacteria bacterium]|nr:hypothetical protein [Deltaproteobacteria bacterium]
MATERSTPLKSGTKLVIGLLALGIVLVIISRVYRVPPDDEVQDLLQQQGVPAARQGITLSREGRKLLPVEEQHEMDALYAEAFQTLMPEERTRLQALAQKGSAANDSEMAETGELVKKALRSLPPDKLQRLGALIEKAVRLQLARQKSAAATEQQ